MELDNSDRLLDVDPTRLPHVISNILHNAIRFTPRGGKITLRSAFVTVSEAAPVELIIRIADTGIGIDREFLLTIFGLFGQGHSDSAVRHGGLGIVLALARSLVELHGGSISADSMGPNQGSEFTIRIPAPALTPMKAAEMPNTKNNLAGIRVLVVDDNQDAADSIGLLIGDLGAEVCVAYDGPSALEPWKNSIPRSCFWTSACRIWMGTKRVGRFGHHGPRGLDRGGHGLGAGSGSASRAGCRF